MNKERVSTSYLMSKSTEELSNDPQWHKFVNDCIKEHGYAWYYHATQQPFGTYAKMNYSKTRKKGA